MTALGWIIIIGTLFIVFIGNSIANSLLGICFLLAGLACIIAGVGYNIQVEIRKKNLEPATPALKNTQAAVTPTNPDDQKLSEATQP